MILTQVETVVDLLIGGQVVAVPTETVYGLAGHGYDPEAIAQIYCLKQRPTCNPLILHYFDAEAVQEDGVWTETAACLARAFWPGPLTLILTQKPACRVPSLATAGLPSLGVRVPSHPLLREVLAACPMPIAAPSANPSGYLSPTRPEHVKRFFSGPILDGGPCFYGLESTILDCRFTPPRLLRPGALPLSVLEQALGGPLSLPLTQSLLRKNDSAPFEKVIAPGQLFHHYAPAKPLRLAVAQVFPWEGLLAFGPPLPGALVVEQLSFNQDVTEASHELFHALHLLDQSSCLQIAVMPIPSTGLGVTIQDRLYRASLRSPVGEVHGGTWLP